MRPETNANAIRLLEKAIALDPGFAQALSLVGHAYLARFTQQLAGASDSDAATALRYARASVATGSDDAEVLGMCGMIFVHLSQQYDEGFALLARAVAENPNNPSVLTRFGVACLLGGDLEEGVRNLERAIKLNPNEFATHFQLTGIAHIRMAQGRYEEALAVATQSLAVNSAYHATYWMLIAANAYLGRMDDARLHLASLQRISPGVTLARIRHGQNPKYPHRIEVLIEGIRMAGMPEA
jgi:adenylate cyclase